MNKGIDFAEKVISGLWQAAQVIIGFLLPFIGLFILFMILFLSTCFLGLFLINITMGAKDRPRHED